MARFSSSGASSTSETCISEALPTSVTTSAPLSSSARMLASSCTAELARRVLPKAVSLAWVRLRLFRLLEELLVLRVGARPAALDEVDAELVQPLRDAQLVMHGEAHPLHLRPVAQCRVVQRYARHDIHSFTVLTPNKKTRPSDRDGHHPRYHPGSPASLPSFPQKREPGAGRRPSAERHHAPAFGNGRRTRSGLPTRGASLRLTAREGSSTGAAHRSHTVTGSLDRRGPVYSSPSTPLHASIPREHNPRPAGKGRVDTRSNLSLSFTDPSPRSAPWLTSAGRSWSRRTSR